MTPLCSAIRPARRTVVTLAALIGLGTVTAANALELAWPEGAERALVRTEPTAGFPIATGAFDGAAVPTRLAQGILTEEVWQIPDASGSDAALSVRLRDQLEAQGYSTLFICADTDCGGFDFRYALPIPAGPEMHVDLGDFSYIAAERTAPDGPEQIALTISYGGLRGYVHIARVLPAEAAETAVIPSTRQSRDDETAGLLSRLTATGSAVLEDLSFDTGASALSGARYESLVTLADWLAEGPTRRIVLVGHTDTEGTLEANITLSQARANAVREMLVTELGADPERIAAAGVGYLAPRAANREDAGREANRRVEVVLVSD